MILKRIKRGFNKFKRNYYNPAIKTIEDYVKPLSDVGGMVGEGIYATRAFLPYKYQPAAELLGKSLMGAQRVIDVGVNVSKAKDYASAIENTKRIIPAIKVGQDLYGEIKQNYLINQAKNRYNPANDVLEMPLRGSRAYDFMASLGTNDRMSNRAD